MFDPLTRDVTIVLQAIGTSSAGKPLYREAGYRLVKYGSEVDRYLEPRSASSLVDTLTTHTILQSNAQVERIAGFEFIEGRASEVHAFAPDYVDVG